MRVLLELLFRVGEDHTIHELYLGADLMLVYCLQLDGVLLVQIGHLNIEYFSYFTPVLVEVDCHRVRPLMVLYVEVRLMFDLLGYSQADTQKQLLPRLWVPP